MFSGEFCEIFKNNIFTEHLPAAGSEFTNATLKELFSCIFALLKQRQHCRHTCFISDCWLVTYRSRLSQMFYKIVVLKNLAKIWRKMSAESFYSKVASYLYAILQGKGSIGRVLLWTFLCFFTEYLRTTSKVFLSFEENVWFIHQFYHEDQSCW